MMNVIKANQEMASDLNPEVRPAVPGLQYVAVSANQVLFEFA
jgi:hypothetical protein